MFERGRVEGDVMVTNEYRLQGTIVGNAIVEAGGYLLLQGTVFGDLVMKDGSTVDLHGTLHGNAVVHGGRLELWGVIGGKIMKSGGMVKLAPNSRVSGIRQ